MKLFTKTEDRSFYPISIKVHYRFLGLIYKSESFVMTICNNGDVVWISQNMEAYNEKS
jgi:hypothetical protein